jgi:Flp pilus assembly protein TadD/arylsulfatase A-like enzyme
LSETAQQDWRKRRLIIISVACVLLLVWLLAGLRRLDHDSFGVLHGPLFGGGAKLVSSSWALAPPGLLRLSVYPRHGIELPLPDASEVMLPAPDGSRFGFKGWITLRANEESWRPLHASAKGEGIAGALVDALRQAAGDLGPGIERGVLTRSAARELEQNLTSALADRGLELRLLQLDEIDYLTVGDDEGAPPSESHLLIIGLDGADWEIMDPMLEAGKLPNIKRLIDDGTRAKLLSISPLLSPVVWTTVATGVEPSRHGILDFLVEDPATSAKQPVTSAQRLVPTVWELLSRKGLQVGVVGWWASWPADPVRGYIVSDRLAYQLFGFRSDVDDARGKTWPPDLYSEIRPLIESPETVPWERVQPFLSGPRKRPEQFNAEERKLLDDFRTLLASGDTYLAIGQELRRRFKPKLEVIYFEGTDTIGHLFMPYRLPELPGVDRRRIESFSDMVDRYYYLADRFVGELLEQRGEEWTVMILSDHGFASDATRPRTTDSRIGHGAAADWHRRFGILILSGKNVRSGARLEEASIYDIAPTIMALFDQPIPRSWPGRVLAQALTEEFIERHPVRFRADDPERRDRHSEDMIDPAAADLLQKLESLGYISAGGDESDSLTARNNAGVALLAEGRFAEAEQEFRAGLEANPGSMMLMVNLGLTLRVQGRLQEAAAFLERALEHPTTLRMAGQTLAQMRLDEGDLAGAESLVRRVLESEPDAASVRNTLGLVLERKGDIAGAKQEYMRASELDPDGALSRNNLGNLAKQAGDLDDAENWYLRAIEADPYFMGAYNNLALVYQARGQMQKAIDLYGRALSKAPENSVVLNNLASLYYATGEHDEARKLWNSAARADPTYPSPLNNLAGLEINAKRFQEAERLLLAALEIDPDYGDARINLALVLRQRLDLEAAREQYKLAVEDPRTGANGWFQWGLFELEQGNIDAATPALERANEMAPRNTETLNALGEAYYRIGRSEQAVALWRRSLEINPNQARLQQVLAELAPQ